MSDHCRLHSSGFTLSGILAFLSLLLAACAFAENGPPLPQPQPPAQVENQQPDLVTHEQEQQQLLQQQLEQLYFEVSDSIGREPVYTSSYLLDLYRKNQFNLLWDNKDNIAQLMGAIVASAEEGLTPDDYHLKALTHYGNELQDHGGSTARKVEYDILLSDALVLLGQHKRYGKVDPAKVEEKQNLAATTPRLSPIDAYLGAIRTGTVRVTLDKLSPHHPSYLNLKEALSQYKKYAGKGGWHSVPLGPSLRPGMVDQRVAAIRNRLAATGEYRPKGGGESNLYDDQLKTAVRAFQARHHVEPDGVVGKGTVSAMNVSVSDRINQIRVNLERTRWVVHDMPSSSLIIDIAGFALQYYHDNQQVWNTKVMVGQPYHQTPIFRSAITYIVLNPTWTPTPDIVKNETVPSIVKDPDYLAKQRLRVFDSSGSEIDPHSIRWQQYQGRYLPYTLRQDPGLDNSLGVIKFLFPNPYHVYLHDTPSKSLFGRTQRAFSHGCIRVQNPLELGRLILTNDPGNPITIDKMNQILASGKTTTVILKQPLPIYLMYLTTNVRDGKVMFKPDLYSRDGGILTALNAPPSRLESAIQVPESKNGVSSNQHVTVEKTVKFVRASDQQNQADPNAKDSL
ncbi:L,D-transpeptidase family protein [Desulfobulbus sp.]|uniref:L,D-transpeptidase family protein n=1 Tax=Desulfobulbus sp. TaxID=895 RepID=UPI00286EF3FE|nr:L,D-transpeptidase family protein [Desulfobulbus sp.]